MDKYDKMTVSEFKQRFWVDNDNEASIKDYLCVIILEIELLKRKIECISQLINDKI